MWLGLCKRLALVAVIALVSGTEIIQLVMSCRVFGLGVESALLSSALDRIRSHGADAAESETIPTGRNTSSLDVFAKAGFEGGNPAIGGRWRFDLTQHASAHTLR